MLDEAEEAGGGDKHDGELSRIEQERITDEVAAVAHRRAIIDQAKGMLMMLHGIDADAAFELLRWQSQETNVKLNAIALQMIADFRELSSSLPEPVKLTYDNAFMTAHTRVPQHLRSSAPSAAR